MKKENCFELGSIVKTKGLAGEVIFILDVDDPQDYEGLDAVFVEIKNNLVPFIIQKIQFQGNRAIVKLEDLDHIDQAKELVGTTLFLPLAALPDLEGNQFYYHEIIDYEIIDQEKGKLGKVNRVYDQLNQDLISMLYQGKEVLIPIVDEIIRSVDREKKALHVNLPEGLIDLYLED